VGGHGHRSLLCVLRFEELTKRKSFRDGRVLSGSRRGEHTHHYCLEYQ